MSFKMYYELSDDRLVNPMKVDHEGVHRTHCCVAHGCKYGDRNCPVETGRIKQDYVCEECGYEGIDNLDDLQKYVMRSMNDEHPLVSEENYVKLYGSEPVTDLTEKVPVSLDLLQRVWGEMFRNPPEDELVEFQNTMDEVIDILDKWHALPDLEDD